MKASPVFWQQNSGFKPSLWNNENKNLSAPEPPLHSAKSLSVMSSEHMPEFKEMFRATVWKWLVGMTLAASSVTLRGGKRSSEEWTCDLSEATLTRAVDLARINLTPFLHWATSLARDKWDAQVARSPSIYLSPSWSPVLALFPVSLSRRILFLWVTPNHLEHQSVKPSPTFPPFFFVFFQKTGEGSRLVLKLACTGMHWHTGKRRQLLTGCQVIEDCQSNFKRPLSSFSALI